MSAGNAAQQKTRCVSANLCSGRNPLCCAAENLCSRKIRCAALQQIFAAENSVALQENPKSAVQRNCLSFKFSFIFSLSWIFFFIFFFQIFLNSIHFLIFYLFFYKNIVFPPHRPLLHSFHQFHTLKNAIIHPA